MDDLGWFCGTDDRKAFGPARNGLPRRHCAADYQAVNELGRRLNMKINCAFILGEWDPDNRLRAIPNFSKYGDGWDNAAYFDREEAARCVQVINDSPYIDMAVHGLIHNNYESGAQYGNTDYFYKKDGVYYPIGEQQVRLQLDDWEQYFKRCDEEFGIILSRDMAFAATQSLYKCFAKTRWNGDVLTVDLGDIPRAKGLGSSFYLSAREPVAEYTGCKLELFETHSDFLNYRVTPLEKVITFR